MEFLKGLQRSAGEFYDTCRRNKTNCAVISLIVVGLVIYLAIWFGVVKREGVANSRNPNRDFALETSPLTGGASISKAGILPRDTYIYPIDRSEYEYTNRSNPYAGALNPRSLETMVSEARPTENRLEGVFSLYTKRNKEGVANWSQQQEFAKKAEGYENILDYRTRQNARFQDLSGVGGCLLEGECYGNMELKRLPVHYPNDGRESKVQPANSCVLPTKPKGVSPIGACQKHSSKFIGKKMEKLTPSMLKQAVKKEK